MMHICKGRLCDLCRACVLEVIVQPEKMAIEPRQALNADEVRSLLKKLADEKTSRETKERLHSRLLSSSSKEAKPVEKSTGATKRSGSGTITPPEPQSHFSSSSGDETTECSEDLAGSFATRRPHVQPHRPAKMTRDNKARPSLTRDKDDQEVFYLDL